MCVASRHKYSLLYLYMLRICFEFLYIFVCVCSLVHFVIVLLVVLLVRISKIHKQINSIIDSILKIYHNTFVIRYSVI